MSFGDIKFNRDGTASIPDLDLRKLLKEHIHKGKIAEGTITSAPSDNDGSGGGGSADITQELNITYSGGYINFIAPPKANPDLNTIPIDAWMTNVQAAKYAEAVYEQSIKPYMNTSEEVKKPEYVNIMLMEEVHKIDKDKLWASIRAFGDGGIA